MSPPGYDIPHTYDDPLVPPGYDHTHIPGDSLVPPGYDSPHVYDGLGGGSDEAASELIDPEFERPLRPVAPVAQLEFEVPAAPAAAAPVDTSPPAPQVQAEPQTRPAPRPSAKRAGRKPAVPAWEDVLLGVRTSGER